MFTLFSIVFLITGLILAVGIVILGFMVIEWIWEELGEFAPFLALLVVVLLFFISGVGAWYTQPPPQAVPVEKAK